MGSRAGCLGKKDILYLIVDTRDDELPVACFETGVKVAEYFETTVGTVYSMMCRKQLFKNRYEVIKMPMPGIFKELGKDEL